jgi:hypothetical protein
MAEDFHCLDLLCSRKHHIANGAMAQVVDDQTFETARGSRILPWPRYPLKTVKKKEGPVLLAAIYDPCSDMMRADLRESVCG